MSDAPKPETAEVALTRVETVAVAPGNFAYPDTTQLVMATGALPLGLYGALLDLTFTNDSVIVQPSGELKVQRSIVARVRFDLEMARVLRDALDTTIQGLTAPPPDQVN